MTEVTPEQTARRVRPQAAERVRPDIRPDIGWQSPPLPTAETPISCPHMGRLAAVLQTGSYSLGTEWICTCGQVFVVAINRGGKRTLLKPEDVPVGEGADVETPVEPPTPPGPMPGGKRGSTRA